MPRPPAVARLVLSGDLAGGEIWSTGFWMTDTGVSSNAAAAALALIVGGTLNASDDSGAMRITVENMFNVNMRWRQVDAYYYAAGPGPATYAGTYVLPSPRVGTHSAQLPNQVAAVLSLRTNFSGRQNRGRMFLPACGLSLQSTGQWAVSDVQDICDAWATAFTDINASDTGKIVVVSDAGTAAHQVSQVRMDTRPDIQRSRANKQTITGVGATTVTL